MSDKVLMSIVHTSHDLLEDASRLIFRDLVALDVIIEFSSLGQLHYDEDVVSRIEDLIQFDDVWVVDEFKYLDLPFDLLIQRLTLDIMFLFFILRLFNIFTATFTPVKSCLASTCECEYP